MLCKIHLFSLPYDLVARFDWYIGTAKNDICVERGCNKSTN